jgi:hypothetical protein
MATDNRVLVSPGVYTSEKDLTFVAQSIGVTTLGMVGETLKGPAFEPVLIKSYDEFRTYFGSTSPLKDGDGNPSYELPYFAKSYLQESNQLFVTRILGLTGYLPVTTYGIVTEGAPDFDSTSIPNESSGELIATTTGVTGSTFYAELSGKTATDGTSVTDFIVAGIYSAGEYFTIGLVPTGSTSSLTGTTLTGPIGDYVNYAWYNNFYDEAAGEVYSYLLIYDYGTSSSFTVTKFTYTGVTVNNYDNLVVTGLRSRGSYTVSTLNLQVTQISGLTMTGTAIETNPLGEFVLTVTADGVTGLTHSFTCSLDTSSTKYITKVLGTGVFDKNEDDYPLYVYEVYSEFLKSLNDRGLVRGLSLTPIVHSVGNDFLEGWQTAASPYVVSEVRGGAVDNLFRVIAISDGDASNVQIKISIVNVDLDTAEFDILVRDFNDTDDNMVVLERFTRCSMNPDLPGYIALKIGTSDTEYELKSKYIMLEMVDNHPTDAVPAGFRGFTADSLTGLAVIGNLLYKTRYYDAGDIVTYDGGEPVEESGDRVKRVILGLSSQVGYDNSLFKYKGVAANTTTPGFHLSSQAAALTGSTITGYEFDCTPYDLEGQTGGAANKLTEVSYRKFTFALNGGFDGWDVYRKVRTFGDEYKFGKTTYDDNNTDNGGTFNPDAGNSDYYAYLTGIETFENPEAVDINVFATPGINFYDHSSLTEEAIDMIENERADSLYIISSRNVLTAAEVIDDMDIVDLDSNYSAVYWPWIQVRDNENSTQLYIPPTGEVLKNIALTDNVSYPWFAVAGYSRGIVDAIKAAKKLTLDERDNLYKMRINPIATFSDTGPIIWGNKTLQIKESALDRINVRRLLLRARKLIAAVAVRLLFDQNDEQVRNEFSRLVNPILESIKKERGLYDFRLVVSNDPEDIDANTLRGKIYIKPTRSLEFIDIEFIITPTGASFENI